MVVGWILFAVIVVCIVWWFVHRDPNRYCPPQEGFVSPADGIVTRIIDVTDKKHFIPKKKNGISVFLKDFPDAKVMIVITLKIWDVHTQRAPIAGTISSLTHKDGSYRNAVHGAVDTATAENEHAGMTITGKKQCRVYMIAGLVARRIVALVQQHDHVTQGQRIAKIRLGSQCVLVLPKSNLFVNVGDNVYAGLTVLAK